MNQCVGARYHNHPLHSESGCSKVRDITLDFSAITHIDGTYFDPLQWRSGLNPAVRHGTFILMSEAAGTEGVAPPFELAALRDALRGVSKECV